MIGWYAQCRERKKKGGIRQAIMLSLLCLLFPFLCRECCITRGVPREYTPRKLRKDYSSPRHADTPSHMHYSQAVAPATATGTILSNTNKPKKPVPYKTNKKEKAPVLVRDGPPLSLLLPPSCSPSSFSCSS